MRRDSSRSFARTVSQIPVLGTLARSSWRFVGRALSRLRRGSFEGSGSYWEARYAAGGTSGTGSYGQFAEFKAEWINEFVRSHQISSVVELGCGDGNQLSLMEYPRYLGLDISPSVVERCAERFKDAPSWSFHTYEPPELDTASLRAELALSLDVIFHLVEQQTFEQYMTDLFALATRYVVIYSDDSDENSPSQGAHIRHHKFSTWLEAHRPDWQLARRVPNRYTFRGDYRTGSYSDFFVYERRQ